MMARGDVTREDAIEHVAHALLPRASLLTRLMLKQGRWDLTRSEAGLLAALRDGPQRITALAELEGVAQPTVTVLVNRLEERGWVARDRHAKDARVVLVSLTGAGREVLDAFREQYHAILREQMAGMDDDQVAALLTATEALGAIAENLKGERGPAGPGVSPPPGAARAARTSA
jgi:DNA-binding MarR family transcriptional regulator